MQSIQKIGERQKITGSQGEDKDVIALAADEEDAVVQVFFIRDGKMIGRDHFYLRIVADASSSQVLLNFVKQFYAGTPFIPRELMLQEEIEEIDVLEEWLSKKRGQRVHIRVPKKGDERKAGGTGGKECADGVVPGSGKAEKGRGKNDWGDERNCRSAGIEASDPGRVV